jgi:hypothetical protein
MWRLRLKTERGWNDGFHINTKAEAEGLCELLNKIERELATVTEQRDRLAKACDQYSEDESLCKLHEVTEQRDRLVEERDELKKQLIDAKSSTAFWMGKYNNAIQLRGEDPLCDSFWKTLDKLSAERAIADRLAEAGKILAEEYEDRRSQWGGEYLWQKYEDAQRVDAAIAVFTAAVEGGQP